MANIQGIVVTLELETDVKKQSGGSYKAWQLVYKSQDGEIRDIAKPVQGLKFGTLKSQLSALAAGDQFTMVTEKNAAGFLDVKSITKGWDGSVSAPSAPQSTSKSTGNNYQASSYPTADERSKTQNHIIRQSSLAQANATLAIGGKAVTPKQVLEVAEQYVAWVKHEPTGIEATNEMEDDIPV
jgi:hypothetical protein